MSTLIAATMKILLMIRDDPVDDEGDDSGPDDRHDHHFILRT